MTQRNIALLTVAAATLLGAWAIAGQQPQRQAQPAHQEAAQSSVTKEQFERWVVELSNWGRWDWEFMLIVNPLPVENGAGAPINPVAIF